MLSPSLILWIVGVLAICTVCWNTYVLIYCFHAHQFNTQITEERPLKRWVLKALIFLVATQTVMLVILTVVQLIRNIYLIEAVGEEFAPHWLFWVVVVQNILFYGVNTLPAVILFAFCWALKLLVKDREDTLTQVERKSLGMDTREGSRRTRRNRQRHGHGHGQES